MTSYSGREPVTTIIETEQSPYVTPGRAEAVTRSERGRKRAKTIMHLPVKDPFDGAPTTVGGLEERAHETDRIIGADVKAGSRIHTRFGPGVHRLLSLLWVAEAGMSMTFIALYLGVPLSAPFTTPLQFVMSIGVGLLFTLTLFGVIWSTGRRLNHHKNDSNGIDWAEIDRLARVGLWATAALATVEAFFAALRMGLEVLSGGGGMLASTALSLVSGVTVLGMAAFALGVTALDGSEETRYLHAVEKTIRKARNARHAADPTLDPQLIWKGIEQRPLAEMRSAGADDGS